MAIENNDWIINTAIMFNRTGTLFKRTGGLFKRTGTLFKRTGTLFKRTGTLFKRTGGLFKRTGSLFKRTGALFKTTGSLFKRTGALFKKLSRNYCFLTVFLWKKNRYIHWNERQFHYLIVNLQYKYNIFFTIIFNSVFIINLCINYTIYMVIQQFTFYNL